MKKITRFVVGSLLAITYAGVAATQEMPASPKLLQITREFVKPGKGGMAHDKTEGAFVKALSEAKWPTNYVALESLSGKARVLFLTPYASFEAWQKDGDAVEKNATLSAALDHAAAADGEMLDSVDQGVFLFREEMSLRPHPDLSQFRYMEISSYHVKPGHTREWREAVKLVKAAYEKGVPDAHWGMFEQMYGGDGGTFLVFTGRKGLSEIDHGIMEEKQFVDAMGENGMKILSDLVAACVESSQHQLFAVSPRMSYVPESWIKADPDFWNPKAEAAASAPAKEKKAKR
jgi:hypothetical protein